jgi:hypothetical protein
MSADLLIEPKQCPACRCRFTPRRDRQVTCGRVACVRRWQGAQRKGQKPVKALAARRQQRLDEMRTMLREQFGELTVREIHLFRAIWKRAYQRGFNVAQAHYRAAAPTRGRA